MYFPFKNAPRSQRTLSMLGMGKLQVEMDPETGDIIDVIPLS